jgi:hypothetical protein
MLIMKMSACIPLCQEILSAHHLVHQAFSIYNTSGPCFMYLVDVDSSVCLIVTCFVSNNVVVECNHKHVKVVTRFYFRTCVQHLCVALNYFLYNVSIVLLRYIKFLYKSFSTHLTVAIVSSHITDFGSVIPCTYEQSYIYMYSFNYFFIHLKYLSPLNLARLNLLLKFIELYATTRTYLSTLLFSDLLSISLCDVIFYDCSYCTCDLYRGYLRNKPRHYFFIICLYINMFYVYLSSKAMKLMFYNKCNFLH